MSDIEQWRAIAGYEGIYEASSFGRIRSLPRVDQAGRTRAGKTLACSVDPTTGYRYVKLSQRNVAKKLYVHLLVLHAFDGPPPAGMQCRHRDGDRANAASSNLHWGTPQQNWMDKFAHGTAQVGEKGTKTVLTESQVRTVLASSHSNSELGRAYGVTSTAIYNIRTGRSWRYLDRREGAQ